MKIFCEFIRGHAMKIINFKKKKMKLLIKEQHESHENAKICIFVKINLKKKYLKGKRYRKVTDHCHYTG